MISMARAAFRRRLNGWALCLSAMVVLFVIGSPRIAASEPDTLSFDTLAQQYNSTTRPIIAQFCLRRHSTEEQEGELDLERFATLPDIRRDVTVWQKVAEMIDHREMPPKRAKQPTTEQRDRLRGWVEQYLRRGPGACRRSGARGPATPEQRPVHVYPA